MGRYHRGHREHELEPKSYKNPYICSGCKELGIGLRHRCECCDYNLHEHCMFYKSTTCHDFFPNCTFEFHFQPPRGERLCDGCGKPVRGFRYHCKDKGWDLHPYCMNLPYTLKVDDDVNFRLHPEVLKDCSWCGRMKLEGGDPKIRGWSYVSECLNLKNCRFHVYCATEMMLEAWKKESYSDNSSNFTNNNNDHDRLAVALENLELPLQRRLRNGGSGGIFKRIVKMFFKAFVGILLGDPTIILSLFIQDFITSASG